MVRKIVKVRFAHVVAGVSGFVGYFLCVVPVQLGLFILESSYWGT